MSIETIFKEIRDNCYFLDEKLIERFSSINEKISFIAQNILEIPSLELVKLPVNVQYIILVRSLKTHSAISLVEYITNELANRLLHFRHLKLEESSIILSWGWEFDPLTNRLTIKNKCFDNDIIEQIFASLPDSAKTSLKVVDLSECSKLQNLSFLKGFTVITTLNLRDCFSLKSLYPLANLQHIDIRACLSLESFGPLETASDLESIYADNCKQIKDLTALRGKANLKILYLGECYLIKEYEFSILPTLTALEELSLYCLPQLRTLPRDMAVLKKLRKINLSLSGISDISSLRLIPNLTIQQ